MSAAALHESYGHQPFRRESFRREAHQLPAGMLAFAVHGVFFAFLYFGFAWQTMPPQMMRVELWQSLPEPVEVLVEKPKAEEVAQPAPPVKVEQPEIALPEKKPEIKRTEDKPVKKKTAPTPAPEKAVAQERAEQERQLQIEQQEAERVAAEQAEKGRLIKEYGDKIKSKITRNIVMPPGVPDSAQAVFRVTLLPGGSVLNVEKQKSSGNAAYDNAVERAIYKSDPLPLPPDTTMFKNFRILKLEFQPKK